MAQKLKARDCYYVHHGSISAPLRETAETALKTSESLIVMFSQTEHVETIVLMSRVKNEGTENPYISMDLAHKGSIG